MTQTKMKEQVAELVAARVANSKPLLIAGLRARYNHGTLDNVPAQWQRFAPHIGNIPGQVGQAAYGVVWRPSDGEGVEYLCGVEVTGFAGLRHQFTVVSIPAFRYAIFSHHEHASKIRDTVDAIFHTWLPESGHEAAATAETPDFFERYSEEFDPKTGMGGMEVWVPIQS